MLAKVYSCALVGLEGAVVEVEADLNPRALPSVTLVGLPDAAVKESTERVRAAIYNSGLTYPRGRLTVNLAPADLRKEGPAYDLPIAVALLDPGRAGSVRPGGQPLPGRAVAGWLRTARRGCPADGARGEGTGLQVGLCAAERRARSRAGGGDRRLPGGHARPAGRALPRLPPHRAVPRRPAPGRRPAALRGRLPGHQRSGACQAGAGGRGGRRSQCLDVRPARLRQDAARPLPPLDPARA